MLKHILPYTPVHESFRQHGIVLIKGKPKGKNKDRFLYAAHVKSQIEVKPGATMLILSDDSFYRVVKKDGAVRGIKINWRNEDSLKDSISFKSPGKLSVVKNNNKTPYHWKTLSHTNIQDALSAVASSLDDPSYIFESETPQVSNLEEQLVDRALRSAFLGENTGVALLDFDRLADSFDDAVRNADFDGEHYAYTGIDTEITLRFICVDLPDLDDAIKKEGLLRFSLTLNIISEFRVSLTSHEDYEIEDVETTINSIWIESDSFDGDAEHSAPEEVDKKISDYEDVDIDSLLTSNSLSFSN